MRETVNEQLRAQRVLRAAEDDVITDDVLEGLTAVVTVRLAEPQFEGQTKEVLGTSAASRIVAHVVAKELKALLTSTRRGDKAQAKAMLEKVAAAARTRDRGPPAQGAPASQERPGDLVAARPSSPTAAATTSSAASCSSSRATAPSAPPSWRATASSRRCCPSAARSSTSRRRRRATCSRTPSAPRSSRSSAPGSGRTFDLDSARYGKVILMADADVDGAHIRTLLLTLIHRAMQPLLEAGRVYAAVPPLHRIEVITGGGKKNEYVYTYSDAELQRRLAELERKGKRVKLPPQRYKGLGEMDADQLAETTMDPRHRTLRRITSSDAAEVEAVFELLMGNDVGPRREFIVEGSDALDRDRIDA